MKIVFDVYGRTGEYRSAIDLELQSAFGQWAKEL